MGKKPPIDVKVTTRSPSRSKMIAEILRAQNKQLSDEERLVTRLARILHWLEMRDRCGTAKTILNHQPGGDLYEKHRMQDNAAIESGASPVIFRDEWSKQSYAVQEQWRSEAQQLLAYLRSGE